jgi:hypothetical protein
MTLVAGTLPPMRRHPAGYTALIIGWTAANARVPPRSARAATITQPE